MRQQIREGLKPSFNFSNFLNAIYTRKIIRIYLKKGVAAYLKQQAPPRALTINRQSTPCASLSFYLLS